ncbi:MAG TPA: chemotaxis protein CheW [Bryobacteraceae bacterium]|nr:chemotaxis protein CheW [Bryobacteraceae bacterium]
MTRQDDGAASSNAGDPEESGTLLATTFYLHDALCALDASLVEEVVRLRRTTPVPHAPEYLLGVMNLRGKIVSVIDLARKLELGAAEPGEKSRVYIVRDRSELVGLLVDCAAEVIEFDAAGLEPPPANVRGVEGRFLRGVARAGGRLAAVLDADAVLASES